jgi:hypothetical protein
VRRRAWLVFVAALWVLGTVGGANAAAYTATFSPGGAVTATGGAVQLTFNTARKTLNCTTSGFTATVRSGSFSGFPYAAATDVVWLFGASFGTGGRCTVTGGAGITMACDRQTYNLAATTSGNVTAGRIGINCLPTVTGSRCKVQILGSVPATFDNSTSRLTIATSGSPGQLLLAQGSDDGTGSRVACRLLPDDSSISFSDSSRAAPLMTVTPTQTLTVS